MYGEAGQSTLDQLSDILYARNQPFSLLFNSEQRCFHIIGLSDMQDSECVETLSQVQSDAFHLMFMGKPTQGSIIFQFVPILSEREHTQMESERDQIQLRLDQSQHEYVQRQRDFRSRRAIQAQAERLRRER